MLAIIVALFLNESLNKKLNAIKYASVLLGILFILPPFNFAGRYTKPNPPPFFNNNIFNNYKKFIKKDSNVLIIPFGYNGLSLYYQAIDGMYYKTAGGYLGATPSYFSKYPIVHTFYDAEPIPYSKMELGNFLFKHNVKKIILIPPVNKYYFRLFDKIEPGKKPVYKNGVYIYSVSPKVISKYKTLKIKITKPILKAYYFGLLLKGAVKFINENQNINKNMSPEFLEKNGYIPKFFGVSKKKYYTAQDSWIGLFGNANIGIGIGGSYKNLRLIFKKYAKYAKKIYFPYPLIYNNSKKGNGMLLLVFNVDNLKSLPPF